MISEGSSTHCGEVVKMARSRPRRLKSCQGLKDGKREIPQLNKGRGRGRARRAPRRWPIWTLNVAVALNNQSSLRSLSSPWFLISTSQPYADVHLDKLKIPCAETTRFSTSVHYWTNDSYTGKELLHVYQDWCVLKRRWIFKNFLRSERSERMPPSIQRIVKSTAVPAKTEYDPH